MDQDTVYEERIVAFVDILGFRSLIERTETDQVLAGNILWILDYVKGMRDENRHAMRIGSLAYVSESDLITIAAADIQQ